MDEFVNKDTSSHHFYNEVLWALSMQASTADAIELKHLELTVGLEQCQSNFRFEKCEHYVSGISYTFTILGTSCRQVKWCYQ